MKKLITSLICVSVILMGCEKKSNRTQPNNTNYEIREYKNLKYHTLYDEQGKPVTLEQYKGKKIVLRFFVSWCSDCNNTWGDINTLEDKDKDKEKDFVFLSISQPNKGKERSDDYILNHLHKLNVNTNNILFDNEYLYVADFNVNSYPTLVFINSKHDNVVVVEDMLNSNQIIEYAKNKID